MKVSNVPSEKTSAMNEFKLREGLIVDEKLFEHVSVTKGEHIKDIAK